MRLRPLFIGPSEQRAAAQLVAFAHKPENWFYPGKSPTPGDNPKFKIILWTYRIVYTRTVVDNQHYRQLSISVPEAKKLPNPAAIYMAANLFGFTGWNPAKPADPGPDWSLHHAEGGRCIVVVEVMASGIQA